MLEVIFLSALALVWIIFAIIQDLRKREVANWLNFSLIIFALGFRFFYSLFSQGANFNFFYQGLIGFGIFFIIGNVFYYAKLFAGGDAKLMIALGAIIPFYYTFSENIKFFILFFILFLFAGAFYSLIFSVVLSFRNFTKFRKELFIQLGRNKKLIFPFMVAGLFFMLLGFFNNLFFVFGVLFFVLPYLYVYAKSVDECCMVKKVNPNELSEGDWLYYDVKIGNKKIKANWDGLEKKDIDYLKRKHKLIKIRQGIPFTPSFLISFLILIFVYFFKIDLWNSLW